MKFKTHTLPFLALAALALIMCIAGLRWACNHELIPELPDNKRYILTAERAEAALRFAKRHNLSEQYAIFVNYGIPSGEPRMQVWDFKKGTVVLTSPVMHGPGNGSTDTVPQFSDLPGSRCSTLGRFRVTGEHGTKIMRSCRLKGLDINNRNAYSRGLMIHAAKWVNTHRNVQYIPLNEVACAGCVTISSNAMTQLLHIIGSQHKQLLLWNYCEPPMQ